ncbi:hypothetical protein PROFUN_09018 [Planoprotostelium fungivorum]|uniref:Uncharacterized protein n=1 Tax=Planoprotostelium fungivorum TaxID=1890364 RepID=A0A2P6MUY9_9EUKA|nr:hypothetical protein PROFUN_09018 [Planoprotostelium fungivorum]
MNFTGCFVASSIFARKTLAKVRVVSFRKSLTDRRISPSNRRMPAERTTYMPISEVIELEGSEGLSGIQVSDFGTVPLPLRPSFLIALKETAHERSINAGNGKFWILNEDWMKNVKEVATEVIVIPERMILEEPGSQFSMDGDKEENDHFAYLSVILPTEHTGDNFDSCMLKRSGGHIMIRHEYECKIIETELNSKHGYKKIFFYKQANLSTEPILSVQRLQIIFRLHSTEGAPPQPFHTESPLMKQLECGLKQWLEDAERPVLCCPLQRRTDQDVWCFDPSDAIIIRRDDTRKLMMETMSKKLNFYCELGSYSRGLNFSFSCLGSVELPEANILNPQTLRGDWRRPRQSQFIVFYVDKASQSSYMDYTKRLMRQVWPEELIDFDRENIGQLQCLPQDVLQYIIDRYVPTFELYDLYGASRMCRHIVYDELLVEWKKYKPSIVIGLPNNETHRIPLWQHLLMIGRYEDLRVLWESYKKEDGCDPWYRYGEFLLRHIFHYLDHDGWAVVMSRVQVLRHIAEETLEVIEREYEAQTQMGEMIPNERERLEGSMKWLSSVLTTTAASKK